MQVEKGKGKQTYLYQIRCGGDTCLKEKRARTTGQRSLDSFDPKDIEKADELFKAGRAINAVPGSKPTLDKWTKKNGLWQCPKCRDAWVVHG